ncbi:MAG: V-type ATP synthase subunit D [Turneriella sp.]
MKYQLNKPALQKLRRDLAIRVRALPILKAKETALRLELLKSQARLAKLVAEEKRVKEQGNANLRLWGEYPGLLSIEAIELSERSVAGVPIAEVAGIKFQVLKAGLFHQRGWVVKGTDMLREIVRLRVEMDIHQKNTMVLHDARKRATQKVNLYEKVQIPALTGAIRRIRNFLDDKENLSRSAQKIVKEKKRLAVST